MRQKAHIKLTHKIKMERGCADCGYNSSGYALHFDHLPGHEKLHEISEMGRHTIKKILKEIAKCEVVCGNCHALRTVERNKHRRTENEK